jgi:hypothetical protein
MSQLMRLLVRNAVVAETPDIQVHDRWRDCGEGSRALAGAEAGYVSGADSRPG